VNKKGCPENLQASHPGNRNALTTGVYSARVRQEKVEQVLSRIEHMETSEAHREAMCASLAGLVALQELLIADIAAHGAVTPGKKLRDVARLLVTVNRRLERMGAHLSDLGSAEGETVEPDDSFVGEPSTADPQLERWESLETLAFDRQGSAATQVDAIVDLYGRRRPGKPREWKPWTPEQKRADDERLWLEFFGGVSAADAEGSESCGSDGPDEQPPVDEGEFRDRLISELHAIATGERVGAPQSARYKALKALGRLDPPKHFASDSIYEYVSSLDYARLTVELLELLSFDWDDVNAVLEEHGVKNQWVLVGDARPRLVLTSRLTAEDKLYEGDTRDLSFSSLLDLKLFEKQLRADSETRSADRNENSHTADS
jgi:hypothetical protein